MEKQNALYCGKMAKFKSSVRIACPVEICQVYDKGEHSKMFFSEFLKTAADRQGTRESFGGGDYMSHD